jgi:NAD(P)-dependent dehydrogenase (short-subunit alcohol dehydrogenase family)
MSRKYIIYGASGGIGSALAGKLHESGIELHLAGRSEERLNDIAGRTGSAFSVIEALDESGFEKVTSEAGDHIDGLAYCIGTINLRSIARLETADFIHDFQVNALGAALAVKAAIGAMKKASEPASVVLFSSVAAQRGFPLHASIGMAKGAVNGLAVSLAAELAPKIRVNAVAPSLTKTDLAKDILSMAGMEEKLAALHPMKRLGGPDDAAAIAAFLLSPQSGWLTGQIIGVDGGRAGAEAV